MKKDINNIKNIYNYSPVIIQNIMLSLYGIYINHTRYSNQYNKYIQYYTNNLSKSPEEINRYQNINIQYILKKAYQEVPYYRKVFDQYGIDISQIKTKADLRVLPYLEKSRIKENPKEFISNKFRINKLYKISTTGTTGTPLRVFCDRRVRQKNYAFYDRWLKSIGVNPKSSRATFGGRLIVPIEQKTPPFWRISAFQRNTYFSSYHFLGENMDAYVEKLKKISPYYIDAYPSSIYTVAHHILKYNIGMNNVTKAIITSAETLFPETRKIIENAFHVPVYDQYGSVEMSAFIAQCKNGNYHIHTDYGAVEFINEKGEEAQEGEEAEIYCTGFINDIMPLIRYKIGDKVLKSSKKCSCGLPFPSISIIVGRNDDFVMTPEGRRVGRLGPVLRKYPVKEAQYVQNEISTLDVNIVKDNGFSKEDEEKIKKELNERLGYSIKIKFNYCRMIKRGKGGKYKTIVSKLKNK